MDTFRKAILHIGTEKTGTTSIQYVLRANRQNLLASGSCYPHFAGHNNHGGLVAYAADIEKLRGIRESWGLYTTHDVEEFRLRFEADAREEIEAVNASTWIFSTEHCHSFLRKGDEIARLKDIMARYFSEIQIAVYLRRQDLLAASYYSTHVKGGGTRKALFAKPIDREYFDYDQLLDRWARVFGEGNVFPQIYDESRLCGGSVVEDFVSRYKLPVEISSPGRRNRSLQPRALEFLRKANEYLSEKGDETSLNQREKLVSRLESVAAGPGVAPSRVEAEDFLSEFEESNERVRQRWFPELKMLFDTDMSMHAAQGSNREFSFEDAVALGTKLWSVGIKLETKESELVRYWRARTGLAEGRLHDAEKDLTQLWKTSAGDFSAARWLGILEERKGRWDMALRWWEEYARFDPGDHDLEYRLGVAARRAGETDRAIRALEQALDKDRTRAPWIRALGLAYEQNEDFGKAVESLQLAVQKRPGDPIGTAADLARCLSKNGDVAGGIGVVKEMQSNYPGDSRLSEAMSKLNNRRG